MLTFKVTFLTFLVTLIVLQSGSRGQCSILTLAGTHGCLCVIVVVSWPAGRKPLSEYRIQLLNIVNT